jgi:hypothetical protein
MAEITDVQLNEFLLSKGASVVDYDADVPEGFIAISGVWSGRAGGIGRQIIVPDYVLEDKTLVNRLSDQAAIVLMKWDKHLQKEYPITRGGKSK